MLIFVLYKYAKVTDFGKIGTHIVGVEVKHCTAYLSSWNYYKSFIKKLSITLHIKEYDNYDYVLEFWCGWNKLKNSFLMHIITKFD